MLTSLRADIAETLEALARLACAEGRCDAEIAMDRGAETLRWCADDLQERLDEISYLLTARDASSKRPTLAQLRKEIEAVLDR